MQIITNGYIHTCEDKDYECGYICFDNGKITNIGNMCDFNLADFEGSDVIDAAGAHICPGFIDAHCHIGMWEDSMDFEGADGNEDTDPITPQLRAIDAINPFDRCFDDALRAGITSVVTGPGSANVIGGQFAALKTYGNSVDKMLIKAPVAIKMAFGENPKNTYHSKNQAPSTRMGTAALLREALYKAAEYKRALKEYELSPDDCDKPDYDIKLEALLPLLDREIAAKVHAHRADDIMSAIRIAKEFDIDITIEHATEGNLICDILKEENLPLMVGPALCERSKIELKNSSFDNYKILSDAGLSVAIITDHPVVPIEYLPLCAALAVKSGMDEDDALRAITINAAKNCRIDERVGSLAIGKDADIVMFDKSPIDFYAKPLGIWVNGIKVI